ncbi:hypothetical protein [Bradyrhizobium manausense]|uniref:Uncharacterized protein n=1 Tax=Bradyrhizobium manausense TaxID=989370 RepID=A0A0R3E105_9BRAD|nr:hypothetical protein [Bradyrhizobium manausense]KRQ15873.1 hypothetical protein AOQ71_07470 [Bradyrhizobium manausense]
MGLASSCAHGGTSAAGSFIQTLTMVDVATGWTELPAVADAGRFARRRGDQPRQKLDYFWQHHLGNYLKYMTEQYAA